MNTALSQTSKALLASLILGFLLSGVAFAQEEEVEAENEESVAVEAEADVTTDRAVARAAAEANLEAAQETRIETEAARLEARTEIEEQRAITLEEREVAIEATRASTSAEREAKREEMTEQKEERRAALSERSSERIINLAANVSNRMDAAGTRIQDIIIRLESRIEKLEAAGLDVSEAKDALQSAQISLNAAVNNLTTIDVTVQAAVSSADPRSNWTSVKAAYQNIREQLRTAHTEIKASVQALKDAAQAMERDRGATAAVQTESAADSDTNPEVDVTSEASVEISTE
jgi:hypothetical protein